MDLYQSLSGMVTGELTSAQPEKTIQSLNAAGIVLHGVQWKSPLVCSLILRRQDWKKACSICKKQGGTLKKQDNYGLFWKLSAVIHRPVLIVGAVMVLLFYLYLPTRILFVRVAGNESIPAAQIIEAAENCGIRFWAKRRDVRSEKMKNALLSALPQLQWAGVNTSGCVATVSVREGSAAAEEKEHRGLTGMVAARDGFLLWATATRGSLLVQPGQTVKEGQLLISGYEDCGICIRAADAEGEVFAQTQHTFQAVIPENWRKLGRILDEKKKYTLLLGKKRINLWKDSGISVDSCGRMYTEYYVTLPGGFQLPVALCKETYHRREEEACFLSREEAVPELQRSADRQLTQRMIAGEILQRKESISKENGCWMLTGSYVCREMIGRLRQETEWRNEWQKQLNGSSAPSG